MYLFDIWYFWPTTEALLVCQKGGKNGARAIRKFKMARKTKLHYSDNIVTLDKIND